MNKLHTLPNGDGIDLLRVTAVKFIRAMEVPFTSDEAALAFRDELIKLVNSKGQATWKPDQIEAAPDGSGFGDWYQRYRVWNRDKTVVLLHTDVLKDAIEFLNKQG